MWAETLSDTVACLGEPSLLQVCLIQPLLKTRYLVLLQPKCHGWPIYKGGLPFSEERCWGVDEKGRVGSGTGRRNGRGKLWSGWKKLIINWLKNKIRNTKTDSIGPNLWKELREGTATFWSKFDNFLHLDLSRDLLCTAASEYHFHFYNLQSQLPFNRYFVTQSVWIQ